MNRLIQWLKYLGCHKVKLLGLAAVGVAYVQNNFASVGHYLPPALQAATLGAFGCAAFIFGLLNTLTAPDAPPP
jgi:hypothetical protein